MKQRMYQMKQKLFQTKQQRVQDSRDQSGFCGEQFPIFQRTADPKEVSQCICHQ